MKLISYIQKGTDPVHLIHSDEACFPEGLQQLYHHMTGSVPCRLQHHHYSLKNNSDMKCNVLDTSVFVSVYSFYVKC